VGGSAADNWQKKVFWKGFALSSLPLNNYQ
jgi:hypothetical protein